MIGAVKVWAATAVITVAAAVRTAWRFVACRHFTGTNDDS